MLSGSKDRSMEMDASRSLVPEARNTCVDGLPLRAGLCMGSCSTSTDLCRMWTVTRWLKIPHHGYIVLGLLCAVLRSLHRVKSP